MTPNPDSLNKKHLAIQKHSEVGLLAFYTLMRGHVKPFLLAGPSNVGIVLKNRVDSIPIGPERLFSINERKLAERSNLGIWQIGKIVQYETCKELGKASLNSGSVSRALGKFLVPLTTIWLNLPLKQKDRNSTGLESEPDVRGGDSL
ncbi:hypothetical protein TNCV_4715731 [Trichonephila clavipes]|nr:hypothetical protein TNCV_4715731 [Trichonephila clavipes]